MSDQCASEAKKANNNNARDQKRRLNRAAVAAFKTGAQKQLITHYLKVGEKRFSGLSHTGAKENTFVDNSGQTINHNTGKYAGVVNHGSFIVGGQSNVTTYEGGGGARTAAERKRGLVDIGMAEFAKKRHAKLDDKEKAEVLNLIDLSREEGCTPQEIVELVEGHMANGKSMRTNMARWTERKALEDAGHVFTDGRRRNPQLYTDIRSKFMTAS